MKTFSKFLILLTFFTIAFSWTALFEKLERLKEKKDNIIEYMNLTNLSFPLLKELSLKDLINFEAPDIKPMLEKLKYIIPKELDLSHHEGIEEFWTGIFEYFELPKPNDLINCFGIVSGQIFFRKFRTVNDLLQRFKTNDNLKLHTNFAQFKRIIQALEETHACIIQTKDFKHLMDSLHISYDHKILKKAHHLYFQARFASLADEFKIIVDEIDNGNFSKAGKISAELSKKCVKDFKKQGKDLLSYQAFSNGVAAALGLPIPSQFISCYDQKEAKIVMDFFKGFAQSIVEGRWYKAHLSAAEYWEKEGKALLEKIPNIVWNCDMNSNDIKQVGEKIGVDLNSQEFTDKMKNFITNHNIVFYSFLGTMNFAFKRNDYLLAGSTYARLLEAVARSSK